MGKPIMVPRQFEVVTQFGMVLRGKGGEIADMLGPKVKPASVPEVLGDPLTRSRGVGQLVLSSRGMGPIGISEQGDFILDLALHGQSVADPQAVQKVTARHPAEQEWEEMRLRGMGNRLLTVDQTAILAEVNGAEVAMNIYPTHMWLRAYTTDGGTKSGDCGYLALSLKSLDGMTKDELAARVKEVLKELKRKPKS